MMTEDYQSIRLWKASLGGEGDHIERLRTAYIQFRSRVGHLTSRIASSLPNLTVHDLTHLDSLWETADLIAGEGYPLNPLEAFIFGGAILLHDAALCFEAYEGGRDGLRNTPQWRDCRASLTIATSTPEQLDQLADFNAVRALHALRASELAEFAWSSSDGDKYFLLDDTSLRGGFGRLIGEIAESHHWPIERLFGLSRQINAPPPFPREWRVDPVKIACLLRCADAIHLDSRRAPDFLMVLLNRTGVSSDHWKAQNWIARADVDLTDGTESTLLFTSNRQFKVSDAAAWWVAYDAIFLADAEIRSANQLLADPSVRSTEFKIKRIAGAGSPEILKQHIRVAGWEPCSAKLHVGNVERLVARLGGHQLYGESQPLGVAIRELVQNARDAIMARCSFDQRCDPRIVISLIEGEGGIELRVQDNGCGMSKRVLTGPLLDFGTSFWISDLVNDEFPGLRSSRFRPIGKFGIGFYSIFMVSSWVEVVSRRWNEGSENIRTLAFHDGISLRPVLQTGGSKIIDMTFSTTVTLRLDERCLNEGGIEISSGLLGVPNFTVPVSDFVSALIAGLDVPVYLEQDGVLKKIHDPPSQLVEISERVDWLKRISLWEFSPLPLPEKWLLDIAARLRPIGAGQGLRGLAAVSYHETNSFDPSIRTVGGLAHHVGVSYNTGFSGYLDHDPASAKREPESFQTDDGGYYESWAREQVDLLRELNLSAQDWSAAAYSFADLGILLPEVIRIRFRSNAFDGLLSLEEMLEYARTTEISYYRLRNIDVMNSVNITDDVPTIVPLRSGAMITLSQSPSGDYPTNSLMGVFMKYVNARGFELSSSRRQTDLRSGIGDFLDRVTLRIAPLGAHLRPTHI